MGAIIRFLPLVLLVIIICVLLYFVFKYSISYAQKRLQRPLPTGTELVVLKIHKGVLNEKLTFSFNGQYPARIVEIAPGIREYRTLEGTLASIEFDRAEDFLPYLEENLELEFPVRRVTILNNNLSARVPRR
jgi:hypothetical protein